jgi:hypothetical protein
MDWICASTDIVGMEAMDHGQEEAGKSYSRRAKKTSRRG